MRLEQLVVHGLAAARLNRLLSEDAIAEPIRATARENSPVADQILNCESCLSVWTAGMSLAVGRVSPTLLRVLAVSETVILMRRTL